MHDASIARTQSTDPLAILSPRETARMLGNISDTTLWRMRQRGEFPEPVRISPGLKGYRLADIVAWLAARMEAA